MIRSSNSMGSGAGALATLRAGAACPPTVGGGDEVRGIKRRMTTGGALGTLAMCGSSVVYVVLVDGGMRGEPTAEEEEEDDDVAADREDISLRIGNLPDSRPTESSDWTRSSLSIMLSVDCARAVVAIVVSMASAVGEEEDGTATVTVMDGSSVLVSEVLCSIVSAVG